MAARPKHSHVTAISAVVALTGAVTGLTEFLSNQDGKQSLAIARSHLETEYYRKDINRELGDIDKKLGDLRSKLAQCTDLSTELRRRTERLEVAAEHLSHDQQWRARKAMRNKDEPEIEPAPPTARAGGVSAPSKPKAKRRTTKARYGQKELKQMLNKLELE